MDLLIDSGAIVFFIVALHVAVGLQPGHSSLVGCYWDTRLSPATGNGVHITAMTLEACNDHCHTLSSTFFAAQGGNWCHCGEGFDISKVTGDYFCRTSCSGDIDQITMGLCGTRSTVAVYWVCPVGYYGRNCTQRCSVHCRVHKHKNKVNGGCFFNGTCFNGCDTGWKGSTCFTVAPKIVKSRLTIEEFEGSKAVIYCKADGEPRPTYRFYKDKTHFPVPTSGRVMVDDAAGLVKFQPLKAADNGTYTCRASNDVGIDTAAGAVKVKVLEDRTALQAITVILMCTATTVAVIACVLVACKNHRVSAPKPSSTMLERAATEGEPLAVPEATVDPLRTQPHERSPAVVRYTRDATAAVPSISLNELRIQLTDVTPSAPDADDVGDITFIETPPPRYDELFGRKDRADQARCSPLTPDNHS